MDSTQILSIAGLVVFSASGAAIALKTAGAGWIPALCWSAAAHIALPLVWWFWACALVL